MKKVLMVVLAALCLAGCKDDFRKYEFYGGFTAPDGIFYEMTAIFLPSADGCDHLAISQKDAGGNNIAASGCIVRTNIKKEKMEIDHKEIIAPEVKVIMKDGTEFRHGFDYIIGDGDGFNLMTLPNNDGGSFFVIFRKGKSLG